MYIHLVGCNDNVARCLKYNLTLLHCPAGSTLGMLVADQIVLSRERRDGAKGKRRNDSQRGKKDESDEDSNESNGDNTDGDNGDSDGDSGKSQNQRRGRMSQGEGNGCFRNYEVRVTNSKCG